MYSLCTEQARIVREPLRDSNLDQDGEPHRPLVCTRSRLAADTTVVRFYHDRCLRLY